MKQFWPKRNVTKVLHKGQSFVDVPQYREISKGASTTVPIFFAPTTAVELRGAERAVTTRAQPIQVLSHYERRRIQWMKPGPSFSDLTNEEKRRLDEAPLTRDDEATIVKHMIDKRPIEKE